MKSFFSSYPDHIRLQRQGWIYSMIFHGIMGVCAFALVSGLRMPHEPDQFTWNVELVSPSNTQTQIEPVLEAKPEPKSTPPKHQVMKPQPVRPQPAMETVPQDVVRPAQTVAVNQTASTFVPEPLQHSEPTTTIAPITTLDTVEEEQPFTTSAAAVQETATPVLTEPPVSRQAAEPVVQQAALDTFSESTARSQQPAVEQTIAQAAPTIKSDYGWLVKALLGRIDQLKNYPYMARINHWEGKVILRAVIRSDGQVLMVDVQESSGRPILDNDAIETLKKASPLKLEQPLGKPQVAILMPISYALR